MGLFRQKIGFCSLFVSSIVDSCILFASIEGLTCHHPSAGRVGLCCADKKQNLPSPIHQQGNKKCHCNWIGNFWMNMVCFSSKFTLSHPSKEAEKWETSACFLICISILHLILYHLWWDLPAISDLIINTTVPSHTINWVSQPLFCPPATRVTNFVFK